MRTGSPPELERTQLSHTAVFKNQGVQITVTFALFLLFLYVPHNLAIPSKIMFSTAEAEGLISILSKVFTYFRSLILNYFPLISTDKFMSSQTIMTIINTMHHINIQYKYFKLFIVYYQIQLALISHPLYYIDSYLIIVIFKFFYNYIQ